MTQRNTAIHRRVLRLVTAVLGFSLTAAAVAQEAGPLAHLSDLHTGITTGRASSADPTGGNADAIGIKAGETATLADLKGAGSVRHIWVTINSASPTHLRELVVRMYWDGESDPSVECPIGDFFGTGFEYEDIPGGHTGQRYKSWTSLPITVYGRAMNMYFEMPYGKSARITVTNDGAKDVAAFYYHIDYESYADAKMTEKQGRFHAQWRSELTRAVPFSESAGKNIDGKNNYQFMHAVGHGQFVGVIVAVTGLSTGWPGEGDDMFFIDGAKDKATLNGTGMEDYFGSAWEFDQEYSNPFVGFTTRGPEDWSGTHVMYRFHVPDPIYFSKDIRATMEHGHANARADRWTSVAFWYQAEPHEKLEPLPALKDRMPTPYFRMEMMPQNLPN